MHSFMSRRRAQQLRLTVYNADGALLTGIRAQAAAVAFFFIKVNDGTDHIQNSFQFLNFAKATRFSLDFTNTVYYD